MTNLLTTKTQQRYANLFFTPEGESPKEWSLGDIFKSFAEGQENGGRGWGFALSALAELGDAEAQQQKELEHLARYAAQELESVAKGYRVDPTWIVGASKRLEQVNAKIEHLCEKLNAMVLILTDRKTLSLKA